MTENRKCTSNLDRLPFLEWSHSHRHNSLSLRQPHQEQFLAQSLEPYPVLFQAHRLSPKLEFMVNSRLIRYLYESLILAYLATKKTLNS